MASLFEIIRSATKLLNDAGIDDAARDARLLIGHALKLDRAQLLIMRDEEVNAAKSTEINDLIIRRAKSEPVGRILGEREFWGLPFGLNEGTLEPRPDSEILIETALERSSDNQPKRLLDLGTGTGCLLLSLLHEWKEATGLGIDQSEKAVEQATLNAADLELNERASFQIGNWLEGITEKFDLIISNPPYITTEDMKTLQPEVALFDPEKALEGGIDGLNPYRHISSLLPNYLNKNGMIVFEVGKGQAGTVASLIQEQGLTDIQITKDLGGVERCISGKFL